MVNVIRLHGRRKQILCVCVCAALFGDGLASQQRAVGGNERVEVNHLEPGTTGPVQSRHCSSSLILFTQCARPREIVPWVGKVFDIWSVKPRSLIRHDLKNLMKVWLFIWECVRLLDLFFRTAANNYQEPTHPNFAVPDIVFVIHCTLQRTFICMFNVGSYSYHRDVPMTIMHVPILMKGYYKNLCNAECIDYSKTSFYKISVEILPTLNKVGYCAVKIQYFVLGEVLTDPWSTFSQMHSFTYCSGVVTFIFFFDTCFSSILLLMYLCQPISNK